MLKSIRKRFISLLCVLTILLGLMQPASVLASDFICRIDAVSAVTDQNKIYFDVEVGFDDDARLIAALYDGDGTLIETRSVNPRFGKTISLDADEDVRSYKIMLWTNEDNFKPLCSAEGGAVSDIPVYDSEADYNKNARFVSDLGIINATYEDFDKEIKMTRAEFACILCRLLDVEDVANAFSKDNLYTDVESTHWAAGFINLLGQSGIMDGLEEGKFNPYDIISFDDAIASLVRILGYEPLADKFGGYDKLAADLMMTLGVDNNEFKSKDVVNLVANALNAPMLCPYGYKPETTDDYFVADGKNGREYCTLLTDMGVYKISGVVLGVGYGEMEFIAKEDLAELRIEADDELYFETDNSSLDDYTYELVDAYIKKGSSRNYEVVAILTNKNFKPLTIISDDILSYSQNAIKYISPKDGQTMVADIDIEYSRFNFQYADFDEITEDTDVIIKLTDTNGDDIYDAVLGEKYEHYIVEGTDLSKEKLMLDAGTVYLDYEESVAIILCDDKGNRLTLEDFDENDLVAVVSDSGRLTRYEYIKIVKLTDTALKGTVEEVSADGYNSYVVIDGNKYTNMSHTEFEEGLNYIFRLGITGKIVWAEVHDGGDVPSASVTTSLYQDSQSGYTSPSKTASAYNTQYVNTANYLNALGILSDVAAPKSEITRADFAVLLCRTMNLQEDAAQYKDKNIFNDIDSSHYAAGAINLLAEKGIMKALSGNNFCPDANMRYYHAMCSAVEALGYSPMAESLGGYPLGYVKTAKRIDALSDIESEYYLDAEMLVYFIRNIVGICHMEEISDGNYVVLDGKGAREYKTYLTERDIYTAAGIVSDITDDIVTFEVLEDSEDGEFEYDNTCIFTINDYKALDLLYVYSDAYVKKTGANNYELLYIAPNDIGNVVIKEAKDIDYINDNYIEYYKDPQNSSKTERIMHEIDTFDILYNMEFGIINIRDIAEMQDARVVFIENTGDGIYDKAVVTQYTYGFIDSVDNRTHTITIDGKDIELYPKSWNITNMLADGNGNKISISDFEEGDFVAIMSDSASPEDYESFIMIQDLSENKITGMVESTWSSGDGDYVVINEKEYRTNVELTAGDIGHFYIGKTGTTIAGFISDLSDEGIGYILGASKVSFAFSEDKWQIELLTANEGIAVYDVSDTANSAFDRYLASNIDAFGSSDIDGRYLFENASESEKLNGARLIYYKLNPKGEISEFERLETNGATQLENSVYDANSKTLSGAVLDDNALVFNISEDYAFDISCLRQGGKYSGCVLKDADNKNSFVIITDLDMENAEIGDLVNTDTAFAIVKHISFGEKNCMVVDYTCNETDGTVVIGPGAMMQGDIDNIVFGDVFAFIADDNGNVTDYAVIARRTYNGLSISQAGIEAVSGEDTQFIHGYIANERMTVIGGGMEILDIDDGSDYIETIGVRRGYANQYTFDDSGRKVEIIAGGFMEHPNMDYYNKEDGYTSKVFIKLVDEETTDIYGYYAP